MSASHSARATRALRRLGERDPTLAALALWCGHRDGAAGPSAAWSDSATIWYGPAFEALAAHEQEGLAAHHVLHVAFRHAPRAAGMERRFGPSFDAELFNLAADALVNETLLLAGYALPRPAVALTGLLAEALGETTTAEAAVGRWDVEALYLLLRQRPAGDRGRRSATDDGAASDGAAGQKARAYALARGFAKDIERGRSDPDSGRREAVEEAEWRQRVARAFEAGRRAGTGIGALGWRPADLPQARTPWEAVLRALVETAVIQVPRRAPSRPSRRWIAMEAAARATGAPAPAFEPAIARERSAPRLAVCIDASGSVDDAVLALFAAQVAGIGRRTGAEVHVLVFDEAVRAHVRMGGANWEREITGVAFAREGGTSFVAALAEAARLAPAAIVVLTDLDGPFGPPPGRVPVIWAVPEAAPRRTPPFGRVLSLAR